MPHFEIIQALALPKSPRPIVGIGAGGIVNDAHQPAYRKVGFTTYGIFDVDHEKAQAVASKFAIGRVFATLSEAVTEAPAGAVFDVAVPASALLDILSRLPDGAAVLVQKPMGNTFEEAKAIRDLCRQKRLTAAVNFQMRYAPYVLGARSLIEQGVIGELHDLEVRVTVYTPWQLWPFLEKLPRVEVLYHSVHYLDLMRSFLGEPTGVYAKTVKHPATPKLASTRTAILLDYGDTLRATTETNHAHVYGAKHQESFVKWEGTKGAIKATMGLYLDYPEGQPDTLEYCVLEKNESPMWRNVPVEGSWFPDAFIGSMSSLMCYLEGSSHVLPTRVDDAFKTMALVEAAHRSSDAGGMPIPE